MKGATCLYKMQSCCSIFHSPEELQIKIRSLSSNKPYRVVKNFTFHKPEAFKQHATTETHSDHLIVLTQKYQNNDGNIFVLNWKTGEIKLVGFNFISKTPEFSKLTISVACSKHQRRLWLIETRWIILPFKDKETCWILNVYDLDSTSVQPTRTFELPELITPESIDFSSESWHAFSSCRSSSQDYTLVFHPNQEYEILEIPFDVTTGIESGHNFEGMRSFALIIPTSTIRKHLLHGYTDGSNPSSSVGLSQAVPGSTGDPMVSACLKMTCNGTWLPFLGHGLVSRFITVTEDIL